MSVGKQFKFDWFTRPLFGTLKQLRRFVPEVQELSVAAVATLRPETMLRRVHLASRGRAF